MVIGFQILLIFLVVLLLRLQVKLMLLFRMTLKSLILLKLRNSVNGKSICLILLIKELWLI